jgi:hypothetical protein
VLREIYGQSAHDVLDERITSTALPAGALAAAAG